MNMLPRIRPLVLMLAALLSAALLAGAASALAGSSRSAASASSALATASSTPRAHVSASYLTGIGDQQTEMFTNPLWLQLHTKIARYIAPYDAAVRPYSLQLAREWIGEAEADHQQVLVAFYHSEYTPTKMPSITVYQQRHKKFLALFPKVKQYQAWNEANRGTMVKSSKANDTSASFRPPQASPPSTTRLCGPSVMAARSPAWTSSTAPPSAPACAT